MNFESILTIIYNLFEYFPLNGHPFKPEILRFEAGLSSKGFDPVCIDFGVVEFARIGKDVVSMGNNCTLTADLFEAGFRAVRFDFKDPVFEGDSAGILISLCEIYCTLPKFSFEAPDYGLRFNTKTITVDFYNSALHQQEYSSLNVSFEDLLNTKLLRFDSKFFEVSIELLKLNQDFFDY